MRGEAGRGGRRGGDERRDGAGGRAGGAGSGDERRVRGAPRDPVSLSPERWADFDYLKKKHTHTQKNPKRPVPWFG
jgi:hypothetical protein